MLSPNESLLAWLRKCFLFYVKKLLLYNYFISMFKLNATESIFVYT